MRLGRLAAAAALVAALGACGAEEEVDPAAEAAAGVADVLGERLGPDAGDVQVTCPVDLEVAPSVQFACSVVVGEAAPVQVDLVVAADGTVQLRRAVVPTAAAEAYLTGELAGPAEGPVEADCGDVPLLVADVGQELRCNVVRTADGSVHSVVVTVLALDGTVRYRVEPAAGTVSSAPAPTSTTLPP